MADTAPVDAAPVESPQAAGTVTVYGPDDQPQQVSPEQATELLRGGDFGVAADAAIPVQGADGKIRALKGQEAVDAVQFHGTEVSSDRRLARQQEQAEYTSGWNQARAATMGLARGVSFGLSDQALVAMGGEDTRQRLLALKTYNEGLSTAGEVGGIALPMLLTGGTGGLVRGAAGATGRRLGLGAVMRGGAELALTAAPRAVGAVAQGAEALALRAGGGGIASRVVGAGLAGGLEGAVYGVGGEVSQAALQNVDLTAERLVAAAGHGALLGGGLGAGLGLAGGMARYGLRRAADASADLVSRGADAAAGAVGRAADATAGAVGRAADAGAGLVGKGVDALPGLVGQGADAAALVARKAAAEARASVDKILAMPQVKEFAGRMEQELALKTTGANQRLVGKLTEGGADMKDRVLRMVFEDMQATGGAVRSRETKAMQAEARRANAGKEIGSMIDELAASGVKADMRAFVREQRNQVVERLRGKIDPDTQRAVKQVDDWFDQLHSASGDAKMVWETKHTLGQRINWRAGTEDVANELKKDLYFGLDREIQRLGTESAEKMGQGFGARWKNANADFRAADWLDKAAKTGLDRELTNRVFGASEQAGILAGALIGGGGVTGAVTGVVGAAVQNLVKRHGADVGAQLAQAVQRGEAIPAIERIVKDVTGRSVSELVQRGSSLASKGRELLVDKATQGGAVLKTSTERGRVAVRAGAEEARQGVRASAEEARQGIRAAAERGRQGVRAATEGPGALRGGVPSALGDRALTARQAMVAREQEYTQRRDQLATYQANPEAVVAAAVGPLAGQPALAAAVAGIIDRGAIFLASKLPQRPSETTLEPGRVVPPSATEQAKFLRYAKAVDDPLSVLADANAGRVTREGPEVLAALYPKMNAELQATVRQQIAERAQRGAPPLDKVTAIQLTAITGVPCNRSLTPDRMATAQAAMATISGGPSGQPSPPRRPPNFNAPALAPRGDQIGVR